MYAYILFKVNLNIKDYSRCQKKSRGEKISGKSPSSARKKVARRSHRYAQKKNQRQSATSAGEKVARRQTQMNAE